MILLSVSWYYPTSLAIYLLKSASSAEHSTMYPKGIHAASDKRDVFGF